MSVKDSKRAVLPRTLAAHYLIAELQAEGRRSAAGVDDDCPRVPEGSPLDSPQSRRAARVLEVAQ